MPQGLSNRSLAARRMEGSGFDNGNGLIPASIRNPAPGANRGPLVAPMWDLFNASAFGRRMLPIRRGWLIWVVFSERG